MGYRELAQEVVRSAGRQGASGAEVMVVDDESFSVLVRMRGVDTVKSAREKRLGVRVFLGQRSATTATSDFSPAALDRLIADTISMAKATPEDDFAGLPEPGAFASTLPDLELSDGEAAALPLTARIDLASRAEAAALAVDPRITNSEGSDYGHRDARVVFANSHGFVGDYQASSVALSVTPVATDGASMQRDGWYSAQRKLRRLEAADAIGRTAAQRALRRLGARKVATQDVPVVFDPDMAASLLRNVFSAVSGSAVYRGASFLVGQLGQRVATSALNVIDDGRIVGALGSRPFDGEGLPTRRTVVIKDGVLMSYLLDTYTGRKLGLTSTGNASRALGQRPVVGPTNLYITPGTVSPQEIIASMSRGLYVTEMIGFGVNVVTGDFSRGAVGVWIENGQLTHAVEEITIAGNLRDMLQSIEMIGNDLEWRGAIASPTLKISRMTVAGS